MSNTEQTELGATAVRALAAAAPRGAATNAVRKAMATRNGNDDQEAAGHTDKEEDSNRTPSDEAPEEEEDDSEDGERGDESQGSAEEDHDQPEASADEGNEEAEDEDPDEGSSDGSSGLTSLRRLADPSRLGNLSHLLVPLAGEAAESAGRYVGEHTSDSVQQQVVDRFVEAYEQAS
jgi:hypothetical protein